MWYPNVGKSDYKTKAYEMWFLGKAKAKDFNAITQVLFSMRMNIKDRERVTQPLLERNCQLQVGYVYSINNFKDQNDKTNSKRKRPSVS